MNRFSSSAASPCFDGRQRAGPVAAAVARQHVHVQLAPALEPSGVGQIVAADDGINHLRLLLAFHRDEIEFEQRELVLGGVRGARADDDRKPVGFALAFQAGGEIDAVAQHRIVEAQVGAHVADDAAAGVDADADVDRNEQRAVGLGRCLALAVEPLDAVEHVEGGFAGVELVGRVVERRVPERHDRVAHVFVDGALAIDDGVGQRRQEAVHQRRQALRIVLVDLRDRGEAAHVAEHDRHVARLAAEHELLRRLRELLDQRRRQILAERRADLTPLRLFLDEIGEHQREIDQQARQQRKGEIDQQLLFREQIPGRPDQQRDEGARRTAADRPAPGSAPAR